MNGNIKNLETVLDAPQDKILLWMTLKYKLVFLLVSLHVSVGRKYPLFSILAIFLIRVQISIVYFLNITRELVLETSGYKLYPSLSRLFTGNLEYSLDGRVVVPWRGISLMLEKRTWPFLYF